LAGGPIEQALLIPDPTAQLAALAEANRAVAQANEDMIGRSAGVFAVLDGPDVDSGTAAEIGWASARDLPIVGWRSDLRTSGDNAAAVVNLQVQHFIERTGGHVEHDLDAAIELLVRLLVAAR
jgi:nucleoside 2-deoxyribosyltransferase